MTARQHVLTAITNAGPAGISNADIHGTLGYGVAYNTIRRVTRELVVDGTITSLAHRNRFAEKVFTLAGTPEVVSPVAEPEAASV